MTHRTWSTGLRRGAIAPLTALLLVPLVGMMAFSIDVSYMALAQAELQNAADAAALAGAEKLQALYVAYQQPGQTQQTAIYTTATTNIATSNYYTYTTNNWDCPAYTAEQFASFNKAGGVSIQLRDVDVTLWYKDGSSAPVACSTSNFPNSIQVIARRDTKKNTPLSLFFGPIFGVNQMNIEATSTATIYGGDITSLQSIANVDAHILPVALDINFWKYFVSTGKTWDGSVTNGQMSGGSTVSNATNNLPQLQVYPIATNTPGSFGLLDTGPPNNSTPAFRDWISDGQTPNDISYLLNNNLLPVSVSSPQSWKCGPGLKSTLQSNFASQMGKSNLIPLFQPVNDGITQAPYTAATGTGQGATYAIVGFAGVTISQSDGNGTSMNISVQPAAVVDPTAVIGSAVPAGSSGSSSMGISNTSMTTFVSAKITQ